MISGSPDIRFESVVNSEGYQALEQEQDKPMVFESVVNSEGYQANYS